MGVGRFLRVFMGVYLTGMCKKTKVLKRKVGVLFKRFLSIKTVTHKVHKGDTKSLKDSFPYTFEIINGIYVKKQNHQRCTITNL